MQPDEVVYDSLISDYDSTYDTSNGYETIPNKLPSAPSERSRMEHFMDTNYVYPGERFDIQVKGLPYSGVIGTYGYWDANSNTWQSIEWSMPESLGETGVKTLTIDLPASVSTSQIQIKVNWYALWDESANDMAERDASTLQFSAVGNAAAPVTTTTCATTRPTTTTTTTTTTKATTTTKKATTTKKTTATTKKTTTTTKATTTTTKPSSGKKVVLKNVSYRTAFDLTPYNDQKIRSITLQFQGSIPNSGGCLVLGNCWNEQHPIAYSDLQNGTITFQIQNPQDVMTIYNYYGLGSLQSVTLNY